MKSLLIPRIAALICALSMAGTAVLAQTPTKKIASPVAYCAVTGEKIGDPKNAATTKVFNGKTYYICCPGCAPKFDATPAKYAKVADLQGEKRNLEAKLSKINAELKKIEGTTAKTALPEIEKTAVAASASLHCAITDEAIVSAKDAAGSEVFNKKTYYFCCPGCVTKFKADPAKYAVEADKRDAGRVNK
ncbi:MAG: YHS domain-containing protein [Akkermansiaceae bacterium]|nr:YHS domain-containing protein [Armatimonadota bacterium]